MIPKNSFYVPSLENHPGLSPKLGLYVPWVNNRSDVSWVGFYKRDVGIRKFLIFANVTGQNSSKIQYGYHFKTGFCL